MARRFAREDTEVESSVESPRKGPSPLGGWLFHAACLLAVAVVLGAYSDSLQNSFHFDDSHVVEGNLYIRNLSNIPLFFRDASTFSSNPANAQYRPLVATTFAIDYWLGGGLHPRQFHLMQIALLVLLCLAIFWMFRRLLDVSTKRRWSRWAALVAATWYGVHTTATETLNLMHVRSELLSALGVVGSFLVYFYFPRSRRAYLYLLPMIVGAFAKTPAVMFAPLFLVYLVVFEQELSLPDVFTSKAWPAVRATLLKALPVFVVAGALFVFVEGSNAPTLNMGGLSRIEYLRTQPFMWLHYGRLFLLPVGLTADTDWKIAAHWYDPKVIAGLTFIALLFGVVWNQSKTPAGRPIAFGVAWFALGLLPASSIFPLAEVTNDHRPFFAYVGLSLAVVWSIASLLERWSTATPQRSSTAVRIAVGLAALVIAGNAVGTYVRNKVFLSEETLWRDVTMKSPANGRGWMNYGLTQMARGRYSEAKALFDRAAIYNPNYATLEINLGIVTGALGQATVAEAHFRRALQLSPKDPGAHTFYARWLGQQGRQDEAISHLQQAIRLSPGDIAARHLLLGMLAGSGRAAELKALVTQTLMLAPGDPIASQYLDKRGDLRADRLAAPRTDTAATLLDRSLHLYQSGDFQGSIVAARKVLQLKPDSAEAYNNIAAGHASLKEWDAAIEAALQALRLRPDFQLARGNLAWAEREKTAATASRAAR
jgi:tetratricopeptide (TPR) repeat protein